MEVVMFWLFSPWFYGTVLSLAFPYELESTYERKRLAEESRKRVSRMRILKPDEVNRLLFSDAPERH